jgi:hypothetical protein
LKRNRLKDKRERFQGAAMAGPRKQNPRGERLTPVFFKQGLVLSPSRQTASSKTSKIKTREFKEGECCKGKALSSNSKRKTALGVDNLGLGRPLSLEI